MEGFCFGIMVNIMFKGLVMSIFLKLPSAGVNCFTNFFFMIVGSVLALQISRPFSLVAMSFIGAFIIIRCIGLFLENFPTEDDLEFDLRYGDTKVIPNMYYFYICLTIALTFFGMLVQFLIDILVHKSKILRLLTSTNESSGNIDLSLLNPTSSNGQYAKESSLESGSSSSWIDEKTSFDAPNLAIVQNKPENSEKFPSTRNLETKIETSKTKWENNDSGEYVKNLGKIDEKKSVQNLSENMSEIIQTTQPNIVTSFNESEFYNTKIQSESEINANNQSKNS